MNKKDISIIEAMLKKYNQEHILKYYNVLNEEQKEDLTNQIGKINIKEINEMYENSKKDEILDGRVSPIGYMSLEDLEENEISTYKETGENVIKSNKVAVITLAGRARY